MVTDIRGVLHYTNAVVASTALPQNTTDPGAAGKPDLTDAMLSPTPPFNPPAKTKQYVVSFEFDTSPSGGVLAYINNIVSILVGIWSSGSDIATVLCLDLGSSAGDNDSPGDSCQSQHSNRGAARHQSKHSHLDGGKCPNCRPCCGESRIY